MPGPPKRKPSKQHSFKREIFVVLELSLLNSSCQCFFSLAGQRQEHKNALVFLTDLASKVGEDAKDLKVCRKDGCDGENSRSITRFSSDFYSLILDGSEKNKTSVKYSRQNQSWGGDDTFLVSKSNQDIFIHLTART